MAKIFDAHAWLLADDKPLTTRAKSSTTRVEGDLHARVDCLVSKIEAKSLDITNGYENWRNIAFALAESFGESGRDYLHRLSRFNASYKFNQCDKQYDKCLKSAGGGITIATLFYIAKSNEILLKN
jgi:hypothetical protein